MHAFEIAFWNAGELDAQTVPFWAWNGEYYKLPPRPINEKHEDVDGKDFSPWQYPEIHQKQVEGS